MIYLYGYLALGFIMLIYFTLFCEVNEEVQPKTFGQALLCFVLILLFWEVPLYYLIKNTIAEIKDSE